MAAVGVPTAEASVQLARGTLSGVDGEPGAGQVTAYLFPSGGGTLKLPLIATATPGPDGRFALATSRLRALAREAAGRGGWVDIMVEGDTPSTTGTTFTSVRVARAGGAMVARSADGDGRLNLRADHPKPQARAAHPCGLPVPPFERTRVASYKRPVVIGEINNAYRDTNATFYYGREQSADTDFSVAVAEPSEAFEIEGENHIGHRFGSKVTMTRRGPFSRKIVSSFRFGKYRIVHHSARCGDTLIKTILKADEWAGGRRGRRNKVGSGIRVCGSVGLADKENYRGRGTFERFVNDAVTWSFGVRVLGVGFKTRSGLSKHVGIKYEFNGPGEHWLCGSNDRPATTAGRIFSGLNPLLGRSASRRLTRRVGRP